MNTPKLRAVLAVIVVVLVSGCVTEKTAAITTTTATSSGTTATEAPATTVATTTTTAMTIQTGRLTEWMKEGGVRIAGISSSTIIKNGEYWMYYTGKDIELAVSTDGLDFEWKSTVVTPGGSGQEMVTNPAVFELSNGGYRMIYEGAKIANDEMGQPYQAERKLYSAVSGDGVTWIKEPGVRFWDYGDGKPGEIFTSVPDVIRLPDGRLRMYYTRGATSATAISDDEGLTWTKETNLILSRKVAVDFDVMLLDDSTYKLFFTTFGDDFGIGEQWMMSAASADGINFVPDQGRLIEPSTTGGLVTDPDVVKTDNGYRMYYGEFRKGETDSNIMSAFSRG